MLEKYADLLVNYCLEIQAGDRLLIQSSTLAEPLVREVFCEALKRGAIVDTNLSFRGQKRLLLEYGSDEALAHIEPTYEQGIYHANAYLNILAPYNLRENADIDPQKAEKRNSAFSHISKKYSERTATRDLKRNLCQYPTLANAQEAGMSLEAYERFVFESCYLFEDHPAAKWLEVRKRQQKIVDYLNQKTSISYLCEGTDITFSTQGRVWINSDGQTNMPSGEVYTSPVEDSVNGVIRFSLPAIYGPHTLEGVTLWVEDGMVVKWEADHGKPILDQVFQIPGTRRFGEAAIGTNYNIKQHTRNILFDEKIGGTVHMAIGQSYLQTGGKNHSNIHWDMITDMTNGGEIWADGTCIYKNGNFTVF